jgi:hypothetical protein
LLPLHVAATIQRRLKKLQQSAVQIVIKRMDAAKQSVMLQSALNATSLQPVIRLQDATRKASAASSATALLLIAANNLFEKSFAE